MDALKKTRARAKAAITRLETFVRNSENDSSVDINEYVIREPFLVKAFEDYITVQNQIEDQDESQVDDRVDIEQRYLSLSAKLKRLIQKLSLPNPENSDNVNSRPRESTYTPLGTAIPKISIPIFSGKYDEWNAFIDLFTVLVDKNEHFGAAQKFIYLKTHLAGEPLTEINEMLVTDDNYKIALDLLKKRYSNKLVIINSHLKALLETPNVTKGDANNLRKFLSHIKQHINSLKSLEVPVNTWDLILIYLLSNKLDFRTHQAYELEKPSVDLPKLVDLIEFIEKRCVALENVTVPDTKYKPRLTHVVNATRDTDFRKCSYCESENHTLYGCAKFKDTSDSDKRQFIQDHKLCFNCFGSRHTVVNCTSNGCRICGKKHHTFLHRSSRPTEDKPKETTAQTALARSDDNYSSNNNSHRCRCSENRSHSPADSSVADQATLVTHGSNSQILLGTANIILLSKSGVKVRARALLDSASQTTFITSEIFTQLNDNGYRKIINIQGISSNSTQTNKMVDLKIVSRINESFNIDAHCAVLNKITWPLPHAIVDKKELEIPSDLKLADPSFHLPSKIDMLIGADILFDIIAPGMLRLGKNLPTMQNTYLGWIIAGPAPSETSFSHMSINLFSRLEQPQPLLEELIPKFWQMEEITSKRFLSPEEKLCEKKFIDSLKRVENGAFQVDLPLRNDDDYKKLGDSYTSAARRFFNLEKRFLRDQNLFSKYKQFIDEYIQLGHASYVKLNNCNLLSNVRYFLPHHCVIRESSSSTKLRVVFDASSKSSSGVSLNDIMLKGYTVQPELFDILCRFRTFNYVITADLQKMYRYVRINPKQYFLQNILWRNHPKDPLKCLQLETVTYGTNSAPFLATRCLVQLAQESASTYPLASNAILTQCYVDDILAGASTVEEGVQLVYELNKMLNSAQFHLHKWNSNDPSILKGVTLTSSQGHVDINSEYPFNKVLGIGWTPHSDEFNFSVPFLPVEQSLTKRQVLSYIARMFDPLGLIGPIVVSAKILMQKIWCSKIDWDEQLPPELQTIWNTFSQNMSSLLTLSIPRCIFSNGTIDRIEIHGFSDASLSSFGACLYIRVLYENHSVSCNLLCAKSRVAPIKTISLPRLELCGAVLLARLFHKVYILLDQNIDKVVLWTDSQIVLSWLASYPSRWTTFVANRIAEIQELTTNVDWRHIKSSLNPADVLSRGIEPSQIQHCQLWWHGPQMLLDYNFNIPSEAHEISLNDIPEERKVALVTRINQKTNDEFISNFSSFLRLQRSFAYCLRFIANIQSKNTNNSLVLSVQELDFSLVTLVKIVQSTSFSYEISELKSGKLPTDTSINSLNPFLDENNILRVGGRLSEADISYDQKFPILLPPKSHFTRLLINYEHDKLCHAGPQAVLSNIRLRFWPLRGLREVKRIIRECVVCHRFRQENASQIMGNLPSDRISVARCFQKIGIDFGGPLQIKQSNSRRSPLVKCYIALFICMVTKAIHIELVTSLSTESFLLTFKRFIARRGLPSIIYSDNATNFRGANNQLKELYEFFKAKSNLDNIQTYLASREVQWKFIPPRSPHWGGLWESGIKATKFHIRRIVGNANLTFEELSTVLAQIEAILNSRPITALSNDPSDLSCLTPAHFLVGEPMMSFPEKDVTKIPENRLSLWEKCSKMRQQFWKRWSVEYLNRLQNRPKWTKPYPNLKENMVVLLKEDNVQPLQWPLARIVEVMPGIDKRVRVVKVKTAEGIFVRPISKICPLPLDT